MLSLGTVTRLARYVGVFPCDLHLDDIFVTGLASLMSGKLDGPVAVVVQSARAVVPVLSETRRHEDPAGNKESDYAQHKNGYQPDQMFHIPKFHAHGWLNSKHFLARIRPLGNLEHNVG